MADESSDIVASDEEKLEMLLQDDVKHARLVMPAMDLLRVHGMQAALIVDLIENTGFFMKIDQAEIDGIMADHELFVKSAGKEGRPANFCKRDLTGINFAGKCLQYASFRTANVSKCDFTGADLSHADLYGACGMGVVFRDANLDSANLSYASLTADFSGANFTDTKCIRASFDNSHFDGATICRAVLTDAGFSGTAIGERGEHIVDTPDLAMACPATGSYIAYKAVLLPTGYRGGILRLIGRVFPNFFRSKFAIAMMEVPETAIRMSGTSLRCRCSDAKVLSITSLDGKKSYDRAISIHDHSFEYRVGAELHIDNFGPDRWTECSPGIHHFTTREPAVAYATGSR